MKGCMQDQEARVLIEKEAQRAQQGLQQASNMQADSLEEVGAKKATPKELQQAEVSGESRRK